jgi:hypothetical protein
MKEDSKTEKSDTGTARRKFSWNSICFAVRKIGLKELLILALAIKKNFYVNEFSTINRVF